MSSGDNIMWVDAGPYPGFFNRGGGLTAEGGPSLFPPLPPFPSPSLLLPFPFPSPSLPPFP